MATNATEAKSLWLPGFGPDDDTHFPDLFNEPAPAVVELPAQEPAAAVSQPEAAPARRWKPSLVRTAANADRAITWPAWNDDVLAALSGPVSKFEANLQAIAVLRELAGSQSEPTDAQRAALLRFTGWGGIPASFNLEQRDDAWKRRAQQLTTVLDAGELETAKASVNTSHYTDPALIRWIWQAIEKLGFRGGRVLEPSAGIGHFIGGMPPRLAPACRWTAIELDPTAGAILRVLYAPLGVDVRVQATETAALADDAFDLVVTNVPFGNFQVSDGRNRPYSHFSIHNWFVGKALDLVVPGGLVCMITSSYLMDDYDGAARAYVASRADLLAAFRLPQGAFEQLGGTAVQTDLLLLRRHGAEADGSEEPTWLELAYVGDQLRHPRCLDRYMRINSWYCSHPEFVLGRIDKVSNGYSAVPTAVLDGDLGQALQSVLHLVPADAYQGRPAPASEETNVASDMQAPDGARPGSFVLSEGRIHSVEQGQLVDVHDRLNATARLRIGGLCEIRDRARTLLAAQLGNTSDADLAAKRLSLNLAYDRFVAKHGYLSNRANALAFRRDPDYPLLLSLERYDDEEDKANKADIFHRRTVSRIEEPAHAESPDEALALCMQWKGRVDPGYMARLLQAEPADVVVELQQKGLVYLDPDSEAYETADAYLSGDVKRKLKAAAAGGTAFEANVLALEKVIPEDLPPASIEPRLGAVWIPADVIEAFMVEVLGLESATVRYLAVAGTWSVKADQWAVNRNLTCTQEFGIQRMDAVELIQHALNVQTPTVRDPHPEKDGAYVVNKEQTLAAREKLGALKDRFAAWAYEDVPRRERLCRIYNDTFNCLRQRAFDGSHLKLPGFSHCFELHPSQLNATWRIVQSGNTGLFHAVGAGKTAIMVASSMELRRLGLARKPAHVVPNHMLEQYTAEFVRLYPFASVLMATKEDLAGDRRREFVSRIATGDWDAVILTHSTFELLPMSREFTVGHIKAIIRELELAVRATKADDRSNRIVKQLERMKKVWKVRLERLDNQERKDDFLCWEALGIDYLFTDEAHLHKNLWRHTKMARIAGLPLSNSQRAFDLYLKTRYTMSLHRGPARGVVLATATPVANSMAEIHTFQRYLQPHTLRALGLEQFDAWAATFGETVTALEIAPDGSGYRLNTRFARFINVPDLMGVFCDVSDIRTKEMLKLPVPALKGDKPRTVTCKPSEALKAFVKTLVKRAELLKTTRVDPRVDNMLKITSEGRKAALDMRLVFEGATRDANGKVAQCAAEVHRIWQLTASLKRAQLVFCDLSTPRVDAGFSVYDELRALLIEMGMPEEQIAFVHDAETDAQKARLFRSVREGKVRVLLGSTPKMGIGTNVQKRLVALHELDCPWRPCDVEQREGRILRQGNECDEVEIIRYVTEGSFDAYSWQTVLTKSKFIAQVMSGDKGLRSVEDVELATLSYAEVKALASGNPLVIEKAGVDAEIARYSSLFSVWRNQRYGHESETSNLPMRIKSMETLVAALRADEAAALAALADGPVVVVNGRSLRDREELGDVLRAAVRSARASLSGKASEERLGHVGGLQLFLFSGREADEVHLYLQGQAVHDCKAYQTGPALAAELISVLNGTVGRTADADHRLASMRQRLVDLREELTRPFEQEDRLTALLARQRELARELDIDKDEVGSQAVEADEQALAA
ncbi:MAG: DEAD/DEAH box helicase [Burkholderiales bacterium]|nr:MAG: DEAD/DEAH box helicase [Burkholderiales bacterium]